MKIGTDKISKATLEKNDNTMNNQNFFLQQIKEIGISISFSRQGETLDF